MQIFDIVVFIMCVFLGMLIYKCLIVPNHYHGINSKDVVGKIYHDDDGDYQLTPNVYLCPISK